MARTTLNCGRGHEISAAVAATRPADPGGGIMDLVERVKGILLTPETEWPVIEQEPGTPAICFPTTSSISPRSRRSPASSAARSIGSGAIDRDVPGAAVHRPARRRDRLCAGFVVVYVMAIIIDQLAPSFGGGRTFGNALKLTVYSFTPYWLGGIFQLSAGLRFVGLRGGALRRLSVVARPAAPDEGAARQGGRLRRSRSSARS